MVIKHSQLDNRIFPSQFRRGSGKEEDTVTAKNDEAKEPFSWRRLWKRYPKHIAFIVSNEFCERFSYYGMRSVLLLYYRNYLHFDDDTSTSLYHASTVFVYFFPLVGAIIADSYWGKYKTILILSCVYAIGHVIKTIGSIPYVPTQAARIGLSMSGLFLIAVGTGGIKPCVAAFGADQFTPDQQYVRKQFFSMFYFAINAGGLISTFLTPVFRADVDCYPSETGPDFEECFALSFGVPGVLMLVALVLFVAGTKFYTIYPPEGSVFMKLCKCIYSACRNRWNTPVAERNKDHWLEYANASEKMIRDTKCVLRVLVFYIPLPMFWALFDQQGSRWTLQAIQLNGYVGDVHFLPDQIETLNPLLTMTLIPLLEVTLYPMLRYCKIDFGPRCRMAVGLILAGLAFVVATVLQLEINKTLTILPEASESGVRFINAAPCNVTIMDGDIILGEKSATDIKLFPLDAIRSFNITTMQPCNQAQQTLEVKWAGNEVKDIFIHGMGATTPTQLDMATKKTEDGSGRFTIVNLAESKRTLHVGISPEKGEPSVEEQIVAWKNRSENVDVTRGKTTLHVSESIANGAGGRLLYNLTFDVDVGGVYSAVLGDNAGRSFTTLDLNPNTISMGWIIPQFFLITLGEVFLSITSMEFAYTQAPPTMKSVVAAIQLLTVSLGSVIVLLVAEAKLIKERSNEFILFASLIFVDAVLFAILAYRYVPVDEKEFEKEREEEDRKMKWKALVYKKKKEAKAQGIAFDEQAFEKEYKKSANEMDIQDDSEAKDKKSLGKMDIQDDSEAKDKKSLGEMDIQDDSETKDIDNSKEMDSQEF